MLTKTLFVVAAAAAFGPASGVHAMSDNPLSTRSLSSNALPTVDMDIAVFADANGDSVNDRPPYLRRDEMRDLDRERAERRGQLLNQGQAGLTKAQKNEIKRLRTSMRDQGAAPDQIHAAVGEKLRSYGVAVPVDWGLTASEYAVHRRMTDAQRAVVQALADSLRQQGRTPAEIRAAMAAEYGTHEWKARGRDHQRNRGGSER